MADAHNVVERIRNFLQAGHQTALETLRVLAQEYSDACNEVNRRLSRCDEFLRQGLHSEAIHFAQAEPNLLDVLGVLDFPERQEWDQVVAHHSLPAPPVFLIDTATALNRAYAQTAPLNDLLKHHRRLALERAPIGERLAVLRQIAQRDAGNAVWDQDIVIFEKVRLGQIESEVQQLSRRASAPPLEQLERLRTELHGTPWKMPVTSNLLNTLGEMHKSVREQHFLDQTDQLARDLAAARENKDEAQARRLSAEWMKQTGKDSVAAPSALSSQRANDVLQWLDKLDRQHAKKKIHDQAVRELEDALADPETPVAELEEVYREVAKNKEAVPANLETTYRRRVREAAAARKLRDNLIFMSVVVVGVIALAIFLFVVVINRP